MITQTIRRTYEFVFLRPKGVPEWEGKAIKARTRKKALAFAQELGFQPEEMIELKTLEDFIDPVLCMELVIEPTLAEEYAEKKEERRLREQQHDACS